MKFHKPIFLLLLFFFPSQLGYHLWPQWAYVRGIRIDYLSPTLYFTDILIALLFVAVILDQALRQRFWFFLKTHKQVFKLLILFGFVNIIFSASCFLTLYKWFTFFKFLVFGLYVYLQKVSIKQVGFVCGLSTLVVFVSFCLQLLQQRSGSYLFYLWGERRFLASAPGIARFTFLGKDYLRPYAFFPHPNALAGFCVSAIPFFLALPKGWFKYLTVLMACLMLIFSLSHNALLAGAILLILYLTKNKVRLSYLFMAVVVASFLTPLFLALFSGLGPGISRRYALALISLHMLKDNLFFGAGLGNFVSGLFVYYQKLHALITPEASYWLQPVHNIFLLLSSETGFVGSMLVFVLLFKRLGQIRLDSPLAFSLASILLTGLWDHYWLTLPQSQFFLVLVLAMFFALNPSRKKSQKALK